MITEERNDKCPTCCVQQDGRRKTLKRGGDGEEAREWGLYVEQIPCA